MFLVNEFRRDVEKILCRRGAEQQGEQRGDAEREDVREHDALGQGVAGVEAHRPRSRGVIREARTVQALYTPLWYLNLVGLWPGS